MKKLQQKQIEQLNIKAGTLDLNSLKTYENAITLVIAFAALFLGTIYGTLLF